MADHSNHSGVLAPRPAHVPEELVYDFDMFQDAAIQRDPHRPHHQTVMIFCSR